MADAKIFIEKLSLDKHPEGGWYKRTYQSSFTFKPSALYPAERFASTAIYYLLEGEDYSAFHRLKSDEMWHYYHGSPLQIYVITQSGELQTQVLGNPATHANAEFQILIPGNQWFAAEVIDKTTFSLIGCTVTPGFDFTDFELAKYTTLSQSYPQHASLIRQLTRD